jgi:hypothetical protein
VTRWGSPDLLALGVAGVALLVYALHGFDGMLTRDLGIYSYAGQQVIEGHPPYVGVRNRAGPLAHLLPAIGAGVARIGGFDDVFTMRLLFLGFATLCACAVYLLGRDVLRSRLGGLVASAAFLTFPGFIAYASNGPREKTPMTLFIVCALWAMTSRRWFTAGVFVSLATLCLQIAFFTVFPAVVVGALLLAGGARLAALFRIALGGAVPVAVLAVAFTITGSLKEAVDGFVLVNLRYTEPQPLLERFDEAWLALGEHLGFSLWLLVVGLASLGVLALVHAAVPILRRGTRLGAALPVLAALTVGAVTGLLWNLKDFDSWADLFPLLPLAGVGIGGLFVAVTDWFPRPVRLAAAVVAVALALVGSIHTSVSTRDHRLDQQRESVAAVFGVLPDATVVSVEAPQPLVLTRRTNPTRHQMLRTGLQDFVDDTWPGGLEGFRSGVAEGGTTFVVLGDPVSKTWRSAVMTRYEYIGEAPDWSWYASKSLGEETLAKLRKAAGYDPDAALARFEPTDPGGTSPTP